LGDKSEHECTTAQGKKLEVRHEVHAEVWQQAIQCASNRQWKDHMDIHVSRI